MNTLPVYMCIILLYINYVQIVYNYAIVLIITFELASLLISHMVYIHVIDNIQYARALPHALDMM